MLAKEVPLVPLEDWIILPARHLAQQQGQHGRVEQGVLDLLGRQRPPSPIGALLRLIQPPSQDDGRGLREAAHVVPRRVGTDGLRQGFQVDYGLEQAEAGKVGVGRGELGNVLPDSESDDGDVRIGQEPSQRVGQPSLGLGRGDRVVPDALPAECLQVDEEGPTPRGELQRRDRMVASRDSRRLPLAVQSPRRFRDQRVRPNPVVRPRRPRPAMSGGDLDACVHLVGERFDAADGIHHHAGVAAVHLLGRKDVGEGHHR
mmetsp:Transcript_55409/g.166113  ORF Transcript_55409/g.166113 Transcript_55409/m.166113 type:complete len:259 (-) Transcript_55409:1745-2521(-)